MDPIVLTVLLIIADSRDEADIRQKLGEARKARFEVHVAPTFAEAFTQILEKSFDIFLADLAVSDCDGMQGLQNLIAAAKEAPVVAISSVHDEAQALEAVRAGADDYTVKSRMNTAAFERVLLYAIERHAARRRTTLQFAVSRVLAESQNVAEASDGILRVLCESLKYDLGEIWQIDPVANRLVHARSWSNSSRKLLQFRAQSQTVLLRCGEDLPGRVWQSRAPEWIEDVTTVSGSFIRGAAAISAGLRGAFAIPLGLLQEIFGVMTFFSTEKKSLDEELAKFLSSIANQMGQFMARKFAEEEHQRIGKELALILDSTSEGIYGVNLAGSITFINQSAARMFGCSREAVVGQDAHTLFHRTRTDGTPYPRSECPLARMLQSGKSHHTDLEHFWKMDGSHFAVSYSVVAVLEDARVSGAVVSFNDISEKRQMEIELRHAQKLEAVGGLAAGIAHEINTPIQFIGDNTRFVQDSFRETTQMIVKYEEISQQARQGQLPCAALQELDSICRKIEWDFLRNEIPKALDQMLDGVNRVATIVRAMKEFSHVDRSTEKAPADLNKAIESTLIVARNEVKYVADVDTELGALPPVTCHLGDLNQVFLNLFVNAAHAISDVVKSTGEKGRISVRTWQEGDNVMVAVADTGTGIPERVRGKVFEPFFTTKEVGKGTGQGLALARAIVVEKHGGTLSFETEMGKGTTFFVRLPTNGVPAPREVVPT
ncbi:MAG: ATP-binding protein [Candidatus Acidiferrales bacterium]